MEANYVAALKNKNKNYYGMYILRSQDISTHEKKMFNFLL